MAATNQYLMDEGFTIYQKAKHLTDVESKNDPENEPYKSLYEARQSWAELKAKLEQYLNEGGDENSVRATGLRLAAVHFYIGMNYADTDETGSGEEHLNKCVSMLESRGTEEDSCNVLQNALNQLGILWTGRRQPEKSLEYLQQAENLYLKFKHEVGGAPTSIDELFDAEAEKESKEVIEQKRNDIFEETYTKTLYYLAQVYGRLEENKKAALYCQNTLKRQLETKKYNPYDWALNAATLAQYYIVNEDFRTARHCLASASLIFNEVPGAEVEDFGPPPETGGQADIDAYEKIPRAKSDLKRCWAKYGLALMEYSRDKMMVEIEESQEKFDDADHNRDVKEVAASESNADGVAGDGDGESASGGAPEALDDEKKVDESAACFDLELTAAEGVITFEMAQNFSEARELFLCVQRWLNKAKEFYALDGHCTDYVELVQDYSRAFKILAFFEPDFERQCKMHRRRITMLTETLNQLSQQHYLLICRQLIFEIAETYSALVDSKLAMIEMHDQPPTMTAVRKINALVQETIDYFNRYINTLRPTPDKPLPDEFSDNDVRPALIAKFCMGRLYSKFIEYVPQKRLANMNMSIEHYKFLVDYCKLHPQAVEVVETELDVCREMVQLLPLKMERYREQASLL
ncbi:KIF-binding protein-like [Lineus longissimus]|uniref:KIF-binding protein-like n=1 Tax=Lineus longissimus TaxID=88925 RepID=UPI00315D8E3F